MLRTVCFENFVKFKDRQFLDFGDEGPCVLVGENCSGKSSVLEGIRRCLKSELSASMSNIPDPTQLSYFISNFDVCGNEKKNIICGIVAVPDESVQVNLTLSDEVREHGDRNSTDGSSNENNVDNPTDGTAENRTTRSWGIRNWTFRGIFSIMRLIWSAVICFFNTSKPDEIVKSYYKFAMQYSDSTLERSPAMHVNLVHLRQSLEGKMQVDIKVLNDINSIESGNFEDRQKRFIGQMVKTEKENSEYVKYFLKAVFDKENIDRVNEFHGGRNECENMLHALSNRVVFTFPLRSIGPLQWSKSERIHQDRREENYLEAEKRCEIIKYYLVSLEDGNQKEFDSGKEKYIFKAITQTDDYHFELKNGKISLPKGKYALLKTPEGILEAKAFSILMSSKDYNTIILEDPDRGMHPQFIARMMDVIKQNIKEKRVILTTHNTSFITPFSLPDCFVFRRQDEKYRIISIRKIFGRPPPHTNIRLKQLRLLTLDHMSDILFANKVLFYEGVSEMLFLTELKQQILQGEREAMFTEDEEGYKQLKKNVTGLSLVQMNSKNMVPFCHDICEALEVKHLILVDRDFVRDNSGEEWDQVRNTKLKTEGLFFWLDGDIEDMLIKMSVYSVRLLRDLEKENVSLNSEKYGEKKTKKEKLFLREEVTLDNVRKCVNRIVKACCNRDDLFEFIRILKDDDFYQPRSS